MWISSHPCRHNKSTSTHECEVHCIVGNAEDDLSFFQLLNLVLSILLLVGLATETLIHLSPAATALLAEIDFVVCFFFLFDFFKRLIQAPSKLEFLKWGWIDFISSLPIVGVLQWGRIARVLRILRVLRVYRSARNLWTHVSRNRPKATLKAAFLLAITAFISGSIAILEVETTKDSNIKTPDDSLWWAFTTMITVGCEKYPVTPAGRVIGGMLSLVGVGLTGVYTACVASYFISAPAPARSPAIDTTELLVEMKRLTIQLRCRAEEQSAEPGLPSEPPEPDGETADEFPRNKS